MNSVRKSALRYIDLPLSGVASGKEETPQVIFLHATGFNASTYAPLLSLLPETVPAHAYDLRGHGRNDLPADPAEMTSWQRYADDIAPLLPRQPVVLAGHSMGAVVALLVAAIVPEKVRGLLLIDPPLPPRRVHYYARLPGGITVLRNTLPLARGALRRNPVFPSIASATEKYRGRGAFRSWREEFLHAYAETAFRAAPGGNVTLTCTPAWERATYAAFRHDPWLAFPLIKVPLTLMKPEKNSAMFVDDAAIHHRAPHAKLLHVPGTTHFLPMEKPEAVIAEILALVQA